MANQFSTHLADLTEPLRELLGRQSMAMDFSKGQSLCSSETGVMYAIGFSLL